MSSSSIDEIHNSNHNYDNASHDDAASSVVGDAHMADYVALGWSISSYTQEADEGEQKNQLISHIYRLRAATQNITRITVTVHSLYKKLKNIRSIFNLSII